MDDDQRARERRENLAAADRLASAMSDMTGERAEARADMKHILDTNGKDEAVTAAQAMIRKMDELVTEMRALRSYGRRNRLLIRVLAVSLALQLVLLLAVGWVGHTATRASDRATQATTAAKVQANNARQTCLSSNEARAAQTDLWNYVFAITASPGRPQTPEQVKQVEDFREYIKRAFAQRDCG